MFATKNFSGFTLIEINLDGPMSPSDLAGLTPPEVDFRKGVVISGRAPVWLFAYLVHFYHPATWVGTFDPRLGGAVIVASHTPGVRPGDVVPVE